MCSGSNNYLDSPIPAMADGFFDNKERDSALLELSAADDLIGFRKAVEAEGHSIDQVSLWYGRKIDSNKLGFEERTPLMIAAMFGSKDVLSYIVESGRVDVNRTCGSDKATALHCAVTGASAASSEVIKILIDASADANLIDSNGKEVSLLFPLSSSSTMSSTAKTLEIVWNGGICDSSGAMDDKLEVPEQQEVSTPRASKDASEKKEYPVDLSLPDINNGIYGTDEFRMYTFKVKPCSRAYSHDWTECPFVHPGENARRRDPRKYHYSCAPCPEFRKGSCRQGDSCEYAHGIFESWLHPAQYRTRLCKDEVGCSRRVCFFAHKPEELRPLYASTGSAVPSPRSFSTTGSTFDIHSISSLVLGSPSVFTSSTSTPPMSPTGTSSPKGGNMWQYSSNIVTPALQLSSSRLKSASSTRDMDLDIELLGLDRRQQQQLMDEISGFSSPSNRSTPLSNAISFTASPGDRIGELGRRTSMLPTNPHDIFGSLDPSIFSHNLQGLPLDGTCSMFQTPSGIQQRQNINQQLRSSYPSGLSSSPGRLSSAFRIEPTGSSASPLFSSKSAPFAKRSQSFIDRSPMNWLSASSPPATALVPSRLSDWGSPDGKLNWGIQGEELNKLRKSASFGVRSSANSIQTDAPSKSESMKFGQAGLDEKMLQQYHLNSGGSEKVPAWVEQMFMEHEQMMA